MAQRTEKEETEFKVPETIMLCVNNCGLTGNPATNNMCQKCFNATTATTPSTVSSSASGISASHKLSDDKSRRSRSRSPRSPERFIFSSETSRKLTSDRPKSDESSKREVNRCSGCGKRVGLTGFRCRCGELFCDKHRYSDRHDCSYDYKTVGRETIARENPVVKAAKIVRV